MRSNANVRKGGEVVLLPRSPSQGVADGDKDRQGPRFHGGGAEGKETYNQSVWEGDTKVLSINTIREQVREDTPEHPIGKGEDSKMKYIAGRVTDETHTDYWVIIGGKQR